MRIAISGTSNCGKTTLAEGLAEALSLEVISEYLGDPHHPADVLPARDQLDRCRAIVRAKRERQAALPGGFVSDRSPIDMAHQIHRYGVSRDFPEQTATFLSDCREAAQDFDAIIFPPGPAPESGLANYYGRPDRLWQMWANHNGIIGLAYRWVLPERLFVIPSALSAPDARIDWVLTHCTGRGGGETS